MRYIFGIYLSIFLLSILKNAASLAQFVLIVHSEIYKNRFIVLYIMINPQPCVYQPEASCLSFKNVFV
jgi:hypothetical protein